MAVADMDRLRRFIGAAFAVFGIIVVVFTALAAFDSLKTEHVPTTANELWFALARMLAHTVVAIAIVYFGYQLIRLGERLNLPSWLVQTDRVEMVRALLGVRTPALEAKKVLEKLLSELTHREQ